VVGSFHPWMVLPFLGWLLLYGCALLFFIPRLAKVSQQQADARALMTGRITDAYTNISTVKLFSHAGREADYAQSAMQEFLDSVHGQMRMVSGVETINHFLNMCLIIASGGLVLWLWSQSLVAAGAVAAVMAMSLRLNGISHWVMWELTSLYEQIGTVQDGINTLSVENRVIDTTAAPALTVPRGEVKFDQVNFAYEKQAPLLENFNLTIQPGERIGLVGRSGAGKSTIVNLLMRFFDIQSGHIKVDGQSIAEVKQNSLRQQIGMVTQDTSLLHRSVRENILYGRPDATEEDMIAAARRAEAHDFIQTLRDAKGRTGYDAHVGERGVKLSGGQRQRIAIARVMLKNAPILVLDEATSALDSEVEQAIQHHLAQLMEGKTVIAIAHRLSTIAAMDKLVVLDKGRIVETGTHHELLQLNGIYAKLWAHQSGGFLGE
jgi:ATP-binding cassette, subfamily B, multidrug efflux pump